MDAVLIGTGGLAVGVAALSLAARGAAWAMYGVAAGLLAGSRATRSARSAAVQAVGHARARARANRANRAITSGAKPAMAGA